LNWPERKTNRGYERSYTRFGCLWQEKNPRTKLEGKKKLGVGGNPPSGWWFVELWRGDDVKSLQCDE